MTGQFGLKLRPVLPNKLVKQGRLGPGVQVDPWAAFRFITAPCLVLRGELSDILSADIVKRMVKVKPDLKTAVIPNRGHAPLLDEPASLAAIDAFLEQLPP